MSGNRIIVTGAGGTIGKQLIQKIIDERLGIDIEFLLAIDHSGVPPEFSNASNRKWISKNLWDPGDYFWSDIITSYNIDTILYIETLENWNLYEADVSFNDKIKMSDRYFLAYLHSRVTLPENNNLKIMYLSTDKVYIGDEFPNEMNDIFIKQPNTSSQISNLSIQYATIKLSSEIDLLSLNNIDMRIIRPFALCWEGQTIEWPLVNNITNALRDNKLYINNAKNQGITFTHLDDLIKFILEKRLFDEDVKLKLTSPIINFCRTQNYLTEEFLIQKIINKTESKSLLLEDDLNHYPYVMKTPQIRNMSLIYYPQIPIEIILEEKIYELNPVNLYDSITVLNVSYDSNNIFTASGHSEPLSTIILFLDSGHSLSTTTNSSGSWNLFSDEPINYTDEQTGIAYATYNGVQYDTTVFYIPPANDI